MMQYAFWTGTDVDKTADGHIKELINVNGQKIVEASVFLIGIAEWISKSWRYEKQHVIHYGASGSV